MTRCNIYCAKTIFKIALFYNTHCCGIISTSLNNFASNKGCFPNVCVVFETTVIWEEN